MAEITAQHSLSTRPNGNHDILSCRFYDSDYCGLGNRAAGLIFGAMLGLMPVV